MAVIKPENIRNIALTGHGGSGKTSFAEGILYASGVTNRRGRVEEGNTVSDEHKDEIEKKMESSITSPYLKIEPMKLNIFLITANACSTVCERKKIREKLINKKVMLMCIAA